MDSARAGTRVATRTASSVVWSALDVLPEAGDQPSAPPRPRLTAAPVFFPSPRLGVSPPPPERGGDTMASSLLPRLQFEGVPAWPTPKVQYGAQPSLPTCPCAVT